MEALPSNRGEGVRPRRLTCVECGLVAKGEASGWRAYLTADGELAVYCAGCAEREYGEDEDLLIP